MKPIWNPLPHTYRAQKELLASELGIDPVLASLLVRRGIYTFEEARTFFNPSLDHLHDPFLMKDMDKAVNRLAEALSNGEKVLIYGDYDVDGTTAVTVVYSFLSKQGLQCDYYIPDRYTEGYGFSMKAVEWAKEEGFDLIITLDCGIKDGLRIERANELGIDVIVCDHHNPEVLPPALAVLDPKRPDCKYPYKGLSGCGVGFKLIQGLCRPLDLNEGDLISYLDLVTISIGADIVPLTGENRILAFHGLQQINTHKRPGVAAMLKQAKFSKSSLSISDVVFILAPRINAAGRILSGKKAVSLLLSENELDAEVVGNGIEENNNTRKSLDKDITREALQQVEMDEFYQSSFSTVVCSDGWSKGVIGIVASRLVEKYYKPAIVLTKLNEHFTGSARSIPGIDLYELLGRCGDLLEQFGGHTMAAGLTMKAEKFFEFRAKFDGLVEEALSGVAPVPSIDYDEEIQLSQITDRFFRIHERMAPFGPENMKPIFLAREVVDNGNTKPVGETKSHLKLNITQAGRNDAMDGIGFNLGAWSEVLSKGKKVDMLFTLEENVWRDRVSIQLVVKDIRLSEEMEAE